MAANDLITFRKGTESQWNTANPVLALGEPGYDTTNNILKIGDGIKTWTQLQGIVQPSVQGIQGSQGIQGFTGSQGVQGFTGSQGKIGRAHV